MPAIAALAYHRASGRRFAQPNQELSYSENFLYMLDAGVDRDYRPNPRLARAIDIMFTLHAEHEMNCSTAVSPDTIFSRPKLVKFWCFSWKLTHVNAVQAQEENCDMQHAASYSETYTFKES